MKKIIYQLFNNSKAIATIVALLTLHGTIFAQNMKVDKVQTNRVQQILDMIATGKLQFNATITTPVLLEEPSFTQGQSNFIDFCSIPEPCAIYVQASPYNNWPELGKKTILNIETNTSKKSILFPRKQDKDTFNVWIGQKIFYRACFICGGQSGPWSNTVFSTQDTKLPEVKIDSINTPIGTNDWYTSRTLNFAFTAFDTAAIDTVHLYSRVCSDTARWLINPDMFVVFGATQGGKPIRTTEKVELPITVKNDGCWEFYVGARDAAFTPTSHDSGCNRDSVWVMRGNLNEPYTENKQPHAKINIDSQPPTSNVDCNSFEKFTNDSNFNIYYEWSDPSPGSGVECVELWYIKDGGDPKQYGESDCPPDGKFEFHAKNDGKYEFYTIAIDSAGNREPIKAPECNTFVDTKNPESHVTCESMNEFTNDSTFKIFYDWKDPLPTSGVACVELWYIKDGGDTLRYGEDCPPDTMFEFHTDGDGKYEFFTIAIDNAENREPKKSPECSTFVDTNAPWSYVICDSFKKFTNNDTFNIFYEWGDPPASGVACVELWYIKDGGDPVQYGESDCPPDTMFEFHAEKDGKYEFYTIAIDSAANEELHPHIPDCSTFVDTNFPESHVICESLNDFTIDSTFNIYYEWSDPSPASKVACVELWYIKDGGEPLLYDVQDCPPDTTIEFKAECDGKYEFYTIAVDRAGNREPSKSPECGTFVDVYEPWSKASSPDLITIDTVEVNYSYQDSVDSRSICEDEVVDTSGVKIIWLWWKKEKENGIWQKDGADSTDKDGKIIFPVPSGDGKYYFYTIAEDNAGNVEPAPLIPDDSTIVDRDKPPPPKLDSLPDYSKGTTREICWQYDNPEKVDRVLVECSSSPEFDPVFKSSGWLSKDRTCFTFDSLDHCTTYYYRGITKRLVADTSSWESIWSNTVSSTQDSSAPVVVSAKIRDSQKFDKMWYFNNKTLHIDYSVIDPCAGISEVILKTRHQPTDNWTAEVSDDYSDSFPKDTTTGTFEISLDDGRYELKIVVLDAAIASGDTGNTVEDSVEPKVFTIDTQPPDAVTVPEDSIYQVNNTMVVNWKPEWPKDNPNPVLYTDRDSVGFRGYEIRRRSLQPVLDDPLYAKIDTIKEATSTYVDSFTGYGDVPVLLAYSIWPFDSLENKQHITFGDDDTTAWYEPPPPAPELYPEHEYTVGDSNVIYWKPVPQAEKYFVEMTNDLDDTVKVDSTSKTSYPFKGLKDCVKYSYRAWVRAESRLMSDTSDVVSSTQDTSRPEVIDVKIREKKQQFDEMWYYNNDILHIDYHVKDTCAGIYKVILKTRHRPTDDWTTLENVVYSKPFPKDTTGSFEVSLKDGRHELRLVAWDAAHTPESPGPSGKDSVMDGNKSEDLVEPEVFTIDTQPPDTVTVTEIEQDSNTMVIEWGPSSPLDDGVGFEGYHIERNSEPYDSTWSKRIKIIGPASCYIDTINGDCEQESIDLVYSVLPFDSLGNEQSNTNGETIGKYLFPPCKPIMYSEPTFTPGDSNVVYWRPVANAVAYFVKINNDTTYIDTVTASETNVPDTSHTFYNLSDGKKYCYRVKALDKFERETGWSEPECSIQDATPPTLSFQIKDLKPSQGKQWVYSRNIILHLEASDQSPGKLCYVVIWENGGLEDTIKIDPPQEPINEDIPYEIKSAAKEPIALVVKIFDCAENSDSDSINFVYDPIDDEISVFPNPFEPLKGDIATIRIRDYQNERLEIKIYDLFGNLVRSLVKNEGDLDVEWHGQNDNLNGFVASGGYICVVVDKKLKCKIALLK